jgi:hypothetical protein
MAAGDIRPRTLVNTGGGTTEHNSTRRRPSPPPGGCRVVVFELPPGETNDLDAYVTESMTEFADPTPPGMHATPTSDFDIILNGTVGLELDDARRT